MFYSLNMKAMEENKKKPNQQDTKQSFSSNPEKSFAAGEKGGTPAMKTASQSSSDISTSSGENHSRVSNQNKPTQGAGWQSRSTGSEDTGKKSLPED